MKIQCTSCKGSLPPNLWEGGKRKIECPFCFETVELSESQLAEASQSDHASSGDFGQSDQPAARGTTLTSPNPKIVIEQFGRDTQITIQGRLWSGAGCFLLVFAIFWNMFTCAFVFVMFFSPQGASGPTFFIIPFLLVGAGLLASALFMVFGRTEITMTTTACTVRKTLWNIGLTSSLPTETITKVRLVEAYRQNRRPVYGVGLDGGSKVLKFGSMLSDTDKNWLIEFITRTLEAMRGH